jgi:hypothetical protein
MYVVMIYFDKGEYCYNTYKDKREAIEAAVSLSRYGCSFIENLDENEKGKTIIQVIKELTDELIFQTKLEAK